MSAHERGREDAGAGPARRATEGGEGCHHCICLYTGQKGVCHHSRAARRSIITLPGGATLTASPPRSDIQLPHSPAGLAGRGTRLASQLALRHTGHCAPRTGLTVIFLSLFRAVGIVLGRALSQV
eukprot:4497165-Prymnesium_polylepis.1